MIKVCKIIYKPKKQKISQQVLCLISLIDDSIAFIIIKKLISRKCHQVRTHWISTNLLEYPVPQFRKAILYKLFNSFFLIALFIIIYLLLIYLILTFVTYKRIINNLANSMIVKITAKFSISNPTRYTNIKTNIKFQMKYSCKKKIKIRIPTTTTSMTKMKVDIQKLPALLLLT